MPQREKWPEYAETNPAALRRLYSDVSPSMRSVLDLLAADAPDRFRYEDIDAELGWPRGRFASVFGGFRGPRGANCKRPFRLCPPELSSSGAWETWMDEQQAAALRATR